MRIYNIVSMQGDYFFDVIVQVSLLEYVFDSCTGHYLLHCTSSQE